MGVLTQQGLLNAITFVVFLVVACPLSGLSAEEVVIFGNESKPPKIWKEDSVAKGILVDILKAMENDLSVRFRIETYPWKRAYTSAALGKGGIVGLSKTDERLTVFDYSATLYFDKAVLVVKKDKAFPFNAYEDLRGKTIGTYSGSSYGLEYEVAKTYFKIVEDYSIATRLKKVLAGRIDAAAISPGRAALKNICEKHPELNVYDFQVLAKPLACDPNHLAFIKTLHRQDFLIQFNRVLQQKIQSGFDQICYQHLFTARKHIW